MKQAVQLFKDFGQARGTSAIEFALVMPVFFVIVFGIVVFGSYHAVVQGVQQLAIDAARSSMAGSNESERTMLATNYVMSNIGSYPLIAANHLTVEAEMQGSDNDNNVFVLTVSYDASNMFIHTLPSFVPVPPSMITRSAVIPRGGKSPASCGG